jgi:flagellar biosynthesis/type III secretory pathway protein FliH
MKAFDWISGGDVRLAPGKKVIPAKEFSGLLNAKELVAKLKKETVEFKQKTVQESEKIKEQAQEEGFEEGLNRWAEQIAALEKRIEGVKDEIEALIVPAAISAAKKIVAKELSLKPDTIVEIVRQALRSVAQHRQYVIWVNKADVAQLEEKRSRLKELLEQSESISIRESDEVAPGDCTIETEEGILKVEAERQWKALESAFKSLLEDK